MERSAKIFGTGGLGVDKIKRNERLSVIARLLTDTPNRIHTLGEFCELFGAAKSTVSEDVDLVAEALQHFGLGSVETVAGAAGGARFRPLVSHKQAAQTLEGLARRLCEPGRMLPGGFLYTSDVTSEPDTAQAIGEILARRYYERQPNLVLTMETKGIPIALMTARALNVPLVIARRDSRAYEGPAVKINYVGGGDRIETMALARRAVRPGQRALIVDDFMKGGGTLQGMVDMMREFQAEVIGVGVMIKTRVPEQKLIEGAHSLLILEKFDKERGAAVVRPAAEYAAQ